MKAADWGNLPVTVTWASTSSTCFRSEHACRTPWFSITSWYQNQREVWIIKPIITPILSCCIEIVSTDDVFCKFHTYVGRCCLCSTFLISSCLEKLQDERSIENNNQNVVCTDTYTQEPHAEFWGLWFSNRHQSIQTLMRTVSVVRDRPSGVSCLLACLLT